ncbi:delta-like protein A isoform X2 [Hydra vulgaris]|uniref:Delta-like protein A isoform X2 n=1 Tax=Hydra vulgaris TaxID=6087 RepID=A0ABM4DPU1_HYDVU
MIFIFILYLCQTLKFLESSVLVKINLETFDTRGSKNRDFNGIPCKVLPVSECSFKFEICYGSSSLHCFFTHTLTQDKNTRITRFPPKLSNDITNPLILKSPSHKVNFNLSVTVYTQFHENDKNINLFNRLSKQFSLDAIGTKKHVILGGINPMISNEISFTTSFDCDDNFKPPNCVEKVCIEHDDDINGHFTCGKNGVITCRDGWTDPSKKCLVSTLQPFSKVGCYHDFGPISGKRPFPILVNYRSLIDWNNKKVSFENITMKCSSYAKENGFEYFGIEFWGECWTGATPDINYARDGESTLCWPTPDENLGPMLVGQDSTIMVYKMNKLRS